MTTLSANELLGCYASPVYATIYIPSSGMIRTMSGEGVSRIER